MRYVLCPTVLVLSSLALWIGRAECLAALSAEPTVLDLAGPALRAGHIHGISPWLVVGVVSDVASHADLMAGHEGCGLLGKLVVDVGLVGATRVLNLHRAVQ